MTSEHFSLCWDNFHKNMSMGMQSLLENEALVDVTLAVEGRYFKAHKMVLSVCSPYFRELFQTNPCKHPIVFMKDVNYTALSDLLRFMYLGEVQVAQENLTTFMQTAEALQIKGLTGDGGQPQKDSATELQAEKVSQKELPEKSLHNLSDQNTTVATQQKTCSGSVSKTTNVPTSCSTPSPVPFLTAATIKFEEPSANTHSTQSSFDVVNFKMEPDESTEQSDACDESQLEQYADETSNFEMTDETEDFLLTESGNEEPRAATSTEAGDNEETGGINSMRMFPEKSRRKYEATYKSFMDWRTSKNIDSLSESVLLSYFEELSEKYKSSSLWALYSMLRSTLLANDSVNIQKYSKLRGFLKRKGEGYRAKTTKLFTPDDINKFINEAPDVIYLATKVAFIMGITGGCYSNELHAMNVHHFQDLGSAVLVTIPNTTTNTFRKFTLTGNFYAIWKKYAELRPSHCVSNSFFLNYQKGKCTIQNIGINKLKQMGRQVAKFLKLPNAEMYTGRSFRKSSATVGFDELGNITGLRRPSRWSTSMVEEFIDENKKYI